VADPALLATDLADYLVMKGVAFRDAHHAVGAVVRLAEEKSIALNRLATADVQLIHAAFGPDWISVFDLKRALAQRSGTGMPSPAQVARQFGRWKKLLK
jgi:argininosuccinate lyase